MKNKGSKMRSERLENEKRYYTKRSLSYSEIPKRIDKNLLCEPKPLTYDTDKRKHTGNFYDFHRGWGHITNSYRPFKNHIPDHVTRETLAIGLKG